MVSGVMIANKVNYGLGKGGNATGFPYVWYRPANSGPVVVATNQLGSINAYVSTNKALAAQASDWGKPDRFAAFDPTDFLPGDYLVGQGETYFVGELVPVCGMVRLAICNETFNWLQMVASTPGPGYRHGVVSAAPLATRWPGWLEIADRRSSPELRLQGSVDMPNAQILLPHSLPGQINRGDQLVSGEAQTTTWTVQGAALTSNGWQVTAIRAGA